MFTIAKHLSATVVILGLVGLPSLSRTQGQSEARDTGPGSPRAVVTSFFKWYCLLPASPSRSDLTPIRLLVTAPMFEALSTIDSANTADRQFPFDLFPGRRKPDTFRILRVTVDADYGSVTISLASAGRRCRVLVRLTCCDPQGWSIAEIVYLRSGTLVTVPTPLPSPPPN